VPDTLIFEYSSVGRTLLGMTEMRDSYVICWLLLPACLEYVVALCGSPCRRAPLVPTVSREEADKSEERGDESRDHGLLNRIQLVHLYLYPHGPPASWAHGHRTGCPPPHRTGLSLCCPNAHPRKIYHSHYCFGCLKN